jgi:hypothetical protein
MNPLSWKSKHQLALVCALALEFVLGSVFGMWRLYPSWPEVGFNFYARSCEGWGWGCFGSGVAGALVYIQRLLRA